MQRIVPQRDEHMEGQIPTREQRTDRSLEWTHPLSVAIEEVFFELIQDEKQAGTV